jgi:hypothetical protein
MSDVNPDDSRRLEMAQRNQRRTLNERDYKLMMTMFGILAYLAFANLAGGALQLYATSRLIPTAICALVIGIMYAVAAHQVWVKKYAASWLVALPAILTIVLLAFTLSFAPVALLLNVILLITIPWRAKVQRELAAVPN